MSTNSSLDLALDPRHTAIVVIDLQKGITQRHASPLPTSTVIENAAKLLTAARRAGAQAVLVHVGGSADGRDRLQPVADEPSRMSASLPADWTEFVPELNQQAGDLVILKRQWGAFYGTELDLQLRRRGLRTIVLCGIATEVGVESTARDAYERGYELVFASDAMSGIHAESHHDALERIFPRIGQVRSTEQIISALEPSGGA
jgi:nicotinamidase-related amidase